MGEHFPKCGHAETHKLDEEGRHREPSHSEPKRIPAGKYADQHNGPGANVDRPP
jgi:hypothetical protein